MARPKQIDDDALLAAARAVFLERGAGATTAELAERAGVSEGSLYKRYKNKQALFEAAMRLEAGPPEWVMYLMDHLADDDLRKTLETAGELALQDFRQVIPYSNMSWSSRSATEKTRRPHSVAGTLALARVFQREIDRGRLRPMNPVVLVRVFVGAIGNYATFETVMRENGEEPVPADQFIREHVAIFLSGAATDDG